MGEQIKVGKEYRTAMNLAEDIFKMLLEEKVDLETAHAAVQGAEIKVMQNKNKFRSPMY